MQRTRLLRVPADAPQCTANGYTGHASPANDHRRPQPVRSDTATAATAATTPRFQEGHARKVPQHRRAPHTFATAQGTLVSFAA